MFEGAPIDLRSDTVTKPTAAMRAAIAEAEVGDDLYGEDPTVRRLEERVAALIGKAAAVYVPSGTMANQLALRVHSRAGDDVLVSEGAHIKWYESGAASSLAGVQLSVIGREGDKSGLFSPEDVELAYQPVRGDKSCPPVTALFLENTHNRGGGRVWPMDRLRAVCDTAHKLGLKLHLDGARLWNAAIFLHLPPAAICAPFDTVSVCLSKGLGAPVGSLVCGSPADIDAVRRFRKMYGGAMRQSGILAAAGLYAISHHYDRLQDDHDNAQLLAAAVRQLPAVKVVDPVETNIILFDLLPGAPDAATVVSALRESGVLCGAFGPRRVRLVTHLDVSRAACESAVQRMQQVLCKR